jgi:hypothetical protein
MGHCKSETRTPRVPPAWTLLLTTLAWGCSGPSTPPAPAETAEVHCDACGKVVARQDTRASISPEGIDAYTCQKCLAKSRRRRS